MLTVVSSCPRCGAPIYGHDQVKEKDKPTVQFTCECHRYLLQPVTPGPVSLPTVWQVPPTPEPPFEVTVTTTPTRLRTPYVVCKDSEYLSQTGTYVPPSDILNK